MGYVAVRGGGKAIEESLEIRLAAAELAEPDDASVHAHAEAKRRTLMAELAQNIAHKTELLTARPDWNPAGASEPSGKKNS